MTYTVRVIEWTRRLNEPSSGLVQVRFPVWDTTWPAALRVH